mmetsp:Transcript_23143/g.48208  ORF Transcript_23143/g.48208 Transcript_23143/m.48208 type:complete len:85 (-) Transcript_23143:863-1117(-)
MVYRSHYGATSSEGKRRCKEEGNIDLACQSSRHQSNNESNFKYLKLGNNRHMQGNEFGRRYWTGYTIEFFKTFCQSSLLSVCAR